MRREVVELPESEVSHDRKEDPMDRHRSDCAVHDVGRFMTNSGSDAAGSSLTVRLRATTAELQELENSVVSGDLDPRVLSEFRNAVDHIRNTAWAVQQWVGAKEQSGESIRGFACSNGTTCPACHSTCE
jgi:hypothetical protein